MSGTLPQRRLGHPPNTRECNFWKARCEKELVRMGLAPEQGMSAPGADEAFLGIGATKHNSNPYVPPFEVHQRHNWALNSPAMPHNLGFNIGATRGWEAGHAVGVQPKYVSHIEDDGFVLPPIDGKGPWTQNTPRSPDTVMGGIPSPESTMHSPGRGPPSPSRMDDSIGRHIAAKRAAPSVRTEIVDKYRKNMTPRQQPERSTRSRHLHDSSMFFYDCHLGDRREALGSVHGSQTDRPHGGGIARKRRDGAAPFAYLSPRIVRGGASEDPNMDVDKVHKPLFCNANTHRHKITQSQIALR